MSATADNTAVAAANGLAAHDPTDISTGVFDEDRGVWPELVVAACSVSAYAVELWALSGDELPGLMAYLRQAAAAVSLCERPRTD